MFPLGVYFVVLTPGPLQQTVHHHWHEEAEFVLVTKGAVDIQVGTHFLTVPEGHGAFIHPEEVHSMVAPVGVESECYAVVFHLEMLNSARYDRIQHQFIKPLVDSTSRFPLQITPEHSGGITILQNLAAVVVLSEAHPIGFEMGQRTPLPGLSSLSAHKHFSHSRDMQSLENLNLDRFKTVFTYIESHFQEKIRLGDLSDLIHMSEGHFCRYFKQMTNKKPVAYINDYRVNHAAALLKSTNRTIMDIALDVGFDNFIYFIKVFPSVKQCTPSEFRRLTTGNRGGCVVSGEGKSAHPCRRPRHPSDMNHDVR